jgi:hypothetical protein
MTDQYPQRSPGAEGSDETGPRRGCPTEQLAPLKGNSRRGAPILRLATLLHLLAPMAVAGLLWRGDKVEERRGPVVADQDAELLRINDPVNGTDRLRHRILQNLKVESSYVAITIFDSEVHVIPASTPWTVRCNDISGISIAFLLNGSDPSGGLVLQLSDARPNKEQCLEIALSTANLLATLIPGR